MLVVHTGPSKDKDNNQPPSAQISANLLRIMVRYLVLIVAGAATFF